MIPHPYVVVRLGGVPIEATAFPAGRACAQLARMRASRSRAQACANAACDAVEAQVPIMFELDAEAARALIHIKRDLFNLRLPKPARLARVQSRLTATCLDAIDTAMAALREASAADTQWSKAHAAELQAGYSAALALYAPGAYAQPDLPHALAVTNPALHAKLERALAQPASSSGRDFALLCTSLARYALRAGRKTSPLSSLGVVALASWSEQADTSALQALPAFAFDGPMEKRRQPRFAALEYAFQKLLLDIRSIDDTCVVMLNPSLRPEDGQHVWSQIKNDDAPESRTRGARLAQNKSAATFVVVLQRVFANAAQDGKLALGALRGTLRDALGGDSARCEALLASAWTHGLLQPDLPARSTPQCRLRDACACLASPLRKVLSETLAAIEAAVHDDTRPDAEYARALERGFEALLRCADAAIPVERFQPLIFEDCMLPPGIVQLPAGLLGQYRAEFVAILRAMPLLTADAPLARFRRIIVRMFRERYGDGGTCDDVRSFVERCAETLDRVFAGDRSAAEWPPEFSADMRPSRADTVRRRLFGRLARLGSVVAEIVLRTQDLERWAQRAGGVAAHTSKMFFVQPVDTDEGPLLAVNHVYPGASCTLSRFLPDRAPFVDRVREYLCAISKEGRFFELGGVFGFNANLHPRMSERVLDLPPFPPLSGNEASFDAMRLRHRADRDDLVFEDAHGRAVDVFYLGILTPLLMPRAYQVVRTLCFSADRIEDIGDQLAQHAVPDAQGRVRMPRVRLGGLVLARRAVAVRVSDLPDPGSDAATFFARFSDWADDCGLPHRVYVRRARIAALHRDDDGDRRSDWRAMPGKEAKPMPLDRDCPLTVRILQKNLGIGTLDVVFSEALPDPFETRFRREGRAVVGEFGIELTLREAP